MCKFQDTDYKGIITKSFTFKTLVDMEHNLVTVMFGSTVGTKTGNFSSRAQDSPSSDFLVEK